MPSTLSSPTRIKATVYSNSRTHNKPISATFKLQQATCNHQLRTSNPQTLQPETYIQQQISNLQPATRNSQNQTRNLQPGTHNPKPAHSNNRNSNKTLSRNLQTQNPKPYYQQITLRPALQPSNKPKPRNSATCNPQHETRQPKTCNLQPGTSNL